MALLRVSGEKIDLPFAHTHSSMVYCTLKPGFRCPIFLPVFHGSRARPPEESERCGHQPQPQPGHQHWALRPKTDRLPQHASFRITQEYFSTRPDGSERHVTHRETNHALRNKILHLKADQNLKHMNLNCRVQSDGPTAVSPHTDKNSQVKSQLRH